MAKKATGNKSQAIRDAMQTHPDKSPKEIAELLTAEGYKVNAQYVSTIKSNANAKMRKGHSVMRRRPSAMGGGAAGSVNAALEFIRAAGGLDEAMQILNTVEAIKAAI